MATNSNSEPTVVVTPWTRFDEPTFRRLSIGYTTKEIYRITKEETDDLTTLKFALEPLPQPWTKRFDHKQELINYYSSLVRDYKLSFVAKSNEEEIVGVVIAGITPWHRTVNLWEFHVSDTHRGQGVGRKMMEQLIKQAEFQRLRVIEVETSNRNVGAIRFYRKFGFEMLKVDCSFYSNEDMESQGEQRVGLTK